MGRTSLFERLEADAPRYHPGSADTQARQRIEAIKRHLEQVLNSRQGCSQSSPELGLRDFNGVTQASSDLVVAISADIRRSVEAFEPRIKVTGVRYQPDPDLPLELNFHLDCQVRVNHKEEQVQIEVAMRGRDGYTRVK
ncbi:type VI secretion system baseplate subunit TssE [Pseudomonas sp. 13B_2.1_Bac1]|uniref:type VI secretion system baseplate subunit TssE n=1 Tax=Pseudomonas sp. 13B_2.1_Bac1 TaxID=2971624 RepID=UPI0021C94047|nr:type VI secretion system baseplate subunit TssE [Pseudomonas sp. 13B_2.1_Bac1]MCU1782066.1 type VI secretion system baseplate subunit TssE [Pseudomonas sp. 13B_2.1_Bac1]